MRLDPAVDPSRPAPHECAPERTASHRSSRHAVVAFLPSAQLRARTAGASRRLRSGAASAWARLAILPLLLAWNAPAQEGPLVLDGARHFEVSGRGALVVLTGDVRFHRGDVRFRAERAVWDRSADRVEFRDGFRIDHPSGHIEAQTGRYERGTGSATAEGTARLIDSSGKVELRAAVVRYDRTQRLAEATGNPVFRRLEGTDTLEVRGARLSWSENDRVATASRKVAIRRGALTATCDQARLDEPAGSLSLQGTPVATWESRKLTGEEMLISIDVRRDVLRRVTVLRKAVATLESDPDSLGRRTSAEVSGDTLVAEIGEGEALRSLLVVRNATGTSWASQSPDRRDQISGDSLQMYFKDKKLAAARIAGNAKSSYHHEESGRQKGRNEAQGATIRVAFDQGRIRHIRITGSARGVFYGSDAGARIE